MKKKRMYYVCSLFGIKIYETHDDAEAYFLTVGDLTPAPVFVLEEDVETGDCKLCEWSIL